jgi:hypothetical protein
MEPRKKLTFKQIVEAQARRAGTTFDTVLAAAHNKPRWLDIAEERAKSKGISVEDLLQQSLERMNASAYPGPDCLRPDELEDYPERGLATARQAHLVSCRSCARLVEALQQEPTYPWQVSEQVRALLLTAAYRAGGSAVAESSQSTPAPGQSSEAALATAGLSEAILLGLRLAVITLEAGGPTTAIYALGLEAARLISERLRQSARRPEEVTEAEKILFQQELPITVRHSLPPPGQLSSEDSRFLDAALGMLGTRAPSEADELRRLYAQPLDERKPVEQPV